MNTMNKHSRLYMKLLTTHSKKFKALITYQEALDVSSGIFKHNELLQSSTSQTQTQKRLFCDGSKKSQSRRRSLQQIKKNSYMLLKQSSGDQAHYRPACRKDSLELKLEGRTLEEQWTDWTERLSKDFVDYVRRKKFSRFQCPSCQKEIQSQPAAL